MDVIREINLDDKNTFFYMLNIFHDIIHDYGPNSSEDRWFRNQNLIKAFYSETFTMSVPLTKEVSVSSLTEETSVNEELQGGRLLGYSSVPKIGKFPKTSRNIVQPTYVTQKKLPTFTKLGTNIALGLDNPTAKPMNISNIESKYFEAKQVVDLFLDSLKTGLEFNAFNFMQQLMIEKNMHVFPTFDLSTVKNCAYYAYMITFFPGDNSWDKVNMNYETESLGVSITNINSKITLDTLKLCIAQELSFYLFVSNNLYKRVYTKTTYNSVELLEILANFIEERYIEKCIAHVCGVPEDFILLSDSVSIMPLEDDAEIKMEISGGATNLSLEDCKGLVNEITSYLNNAKNIIENLKNIIQSEDRSKATLDLYAAQRSEIQDSIKRFLSVKGERKKMGMADNLIKVLSLRYNERTNSKELQMFDEIFNKTLSKILHDCEEEIQMSIAQEEQLKKKLEEQAGMKEAGEKLNKLNPEDCKVRQQFCNLIAKLGLWLNNACDANGIVMSNVPVSQQSLGKLQSKLKGTSIFDTNTHNDFVKTQIDILLYYANWDKINNNSGFGTIASQSLDDELYDFISYQYRNKKIEGSNIYCNKCKKYGIDNAATIDKDVRKSIFCPYTSVLDGMVQCSYSSAIGRMEYGNMNFRVGQLDGFYQGKVELGDNANKKKEPESVSYEIILHPYNNEKTFSINSLDMLLKGDSLKAFYALKNTLISVIRYNEDLTIKASNNPQISQDILKIQTYMTSSAPEGYVEGIFGNIYRLVSGTNSFGLVDPLMIDLILNVLVKGAGDIFQEINAVCKFGGYQEYPQSSNTIEQYDNNGDAMRLFVANDRPSASRFCFLLMNGNPSQINTKAFGGYTGPNKDKDLLIIRTNPNDKICMFCRNPKKGGKKTRAKRTKHKTVSRTEKIIKRKIKHTKKRLYQKTL
jgi:hypothetical protein